ncbi:hypothetical protein FPV67DRAFT_1672482 [Lyophyllum atratum]|nr:hypothetical protein FPV67DRAFT_1672482 [Lyophyllum atratum]
MLFDDWDDSDLTDLSDEDETPLLAISKASQAAQARAQAEAAAKPKPAKPKPAKKPANEVIPRLKEVYHKIMSPDSLYRYLKMDVIDLNPEYQRDVVWTDQNQGYLIDSLMHNYAVFPLIFAVRPRPEDGREIMVCIDGKQRITAIQKFMENQIPYRDSQLNRELWYDKPPDNKPAKNVISPAQRQRFCLMNIAVYEYKDISDHEEREIFQRVQNAVALTAHERLKAFNGPNADLVRDMHRTAMVIRDFYNWDKAQGRDFLMLGQIAALINHNISNKKGDYPTTELKLRNVETFLHLKTPPTPKLRSAAMGTIDTLNCLISHSKWSQPFLDLQPTMFVMAGFMVYLHRETLSLAQLADAVRQMKESLKAKTAAKIYKELAAFVVDKVKRLTLKGDGNGDKSAASITFDHQRAASPVATTSASISQSKRKRSDSSSDDDNQAVDNAPKRKTISAKRKSYIESDMESEDDDYDDQPIVKRFAPPKKIAAARKSVKNLASAKVIASAPPSASKGATSVKRPSAKPAASAGAQKDLVKPKASTSAKGVAMTSQVGKGGPKLSAPPSTSLSKKPTTNAVASSSHRFLSERDSSQKSTPDMSPMPRPSALPTVSAASAPLPAQRLPPRPPNRSYATSPMLVPPKTVFMDRIKSEPRPSPAISATPPPLAQTPSFHPDRLAPLRAARAKVAAAADSSTQQRPSPSVSMSMSASSSVSGGWHLPTPDPRPRPFLNRPVTPVTTKDAAEEALQTELDRIASTLTPKPLTPAASVPTSPPLRRPAVASAPPVAYRELPPGSQPDVEMADGTRDVLGHVPPFQRFGSRFGTAPAVPHINTDVDQWRSGPGPSTSGGLASQGLGPGQRQQPPSQPPSAEQRQPLSAPGPRGLFNLREMGPISKVTPTMPAAMMSHPQHLPPPPASASSSMSRGSSGSFREGDVYSSRGGYHSERDDDRYDRYRDRPRKERQVPDPRSRARR